MSLLDLEDPQPLEVLQWYITSSGEAVAALRQAEDNQLTPCTHPHPDVDVFVVVVTGIHRANLNRNVVFLSIDYVSRFLTSPKAYVNQETKNKWQMYSNILTAAIVSLASFMLGVDFDVLQFHRIAGLHFLLCDEPLEPQLYSVTELECMVMEVLEFRLRSVTPLAYLSHFLSLFPPALDAAKAIQDVKILATEKIMSDKRMIMNPLYEPFHKAFVSVVEAAKELYPQHAGAFHGALHRRFRDPEFTFCRNSSEFV